ncbi:hypothetical protein [Pseudoxanthomonas mexicana]
MSSLRFLSVPLLAMALAACGGSSDQMNADDAALFGEDAAAQSDAATAAAAPAAAPAPVQQTVEQVVLANDAVMVGSAVGADGAVSAAKSAYATSDTVYASVPVGGYPPGKEVAMYWFSSKGGSIKDERKPIPAGAKFVNFSLGKADGLVAGSYTAQADIDDNPVGMADFSVK